jgi:hypothetical protein
MMRRKTVTGSDDLIDEVFEALKEEYDTGGQNRASQEELNRRKTNAQDGSLMVTNPQNGTGMVLRQPAVKPALDNRRGRRAAEEEQIRQWRMVQTTNRTALAVESVAAVTVHGYRVMDRTQSVIADEYYGVKRNEAMSELMRRFASKCLSCSESGILALIESHPKRIADDL